MINKKGFITNLNYNKTYENICLINKPREIKLL